MIWVALALVAIGVALAFLVAPFALAVGAVGLLLLVYSVAVRMRRTEGEA